MKKNRTIFLLLIIILFLIGVGIFSYPFIASYLYQQSALEVKYEYYETVDKYSEEELNELLTKAYEYNDALLTAGLILSEPFDPERYDIDAMYQKLPTESPEIGYVTIPNLKVTLPIFHSTTDEVLEIGAGHIPHTSLPVGGENTHAAISAHSGLLNAEMFTNLDKLEYGDTFNIEILGMSLTYQVYSKEVVEPNDITALAILPGEDLVTLITCTPIGVNTHRLLVHGKRIDTIPSGEREILGDAVRVKYNYIDIVKFIAMILIIIFIILLILLVIDYIKEKSFKKRHEKDN